MTRALTVRLGSSVLTKVLAALVVTLVAAGAVTFLVGTRLTRSALADQARQLARSDVRILEEAYGERERDLVNDLRTLAQTIHAHGLTDPGRRPELVAELGRARHTDELVSLEVVDASGLPLNPPAAVGKPLPGEADGLPGWPVFDVTSRVVATVDGRHAQAVTVPVGAGAMTYVTGAREFSDSFAYQLRRLVGDIGHVVLLAGGELAGSTLPHRSNVRVHLDATLGGGPRVARVGGVESIVAMAPVGQSADGQATGALAVVLPDPVAALDQSLARARIVATVALGLVALFLGWLLFRTVTRPLVILAGTAGRIAEGDLTASFHDRGRDEVGRLADCLERMRTQLLAQSDRLQESSKRIVAAEDEARRAIARDLHDGVQQELVVLRMRLGLAGELATGLPDDVARLVDEVGQELDGAIERVRQASQDLYPSILVDRGLIAALHSYVGRLPVSTRLSSTPDPLPRLPAEIESAAYFLISEGLTNALKHADAGEITVSLRLDGTWLVVEVGDDGRGFCPAETPRRGGLLHMEDRVLSFGGDLRIRSLRGRGTSVTARFPVRIHERPEPATAPVTFERPRAEPEPEPERAAPW